MFFASTVHGTIVVAMLYKSTVAGEMSSVRAAKRTPDRPREPFGVNQVQSAKAF